MPADRKGQIAEEFMKLAKCRPVDKITVKDIVTACHITRQTFYYHFQDLMDVIEWCLQQTMESLVEQSLSSPDRLQAMRLFVETAVEARELIRKLLASSQREQAERLLVKTTRVYLQEIIDRKELFQNVSRIDMEVALNFYAFAIVGTLLEACQKTRVNVEQLAGQLIRLLDGTMMRESGLGNELNH